MQKFVFSSLCFVTKLLCSKKPFSLTVFSVLSLSISASFRDPQRVQNFKNFVPAKMSTSISIDDLPPEMIDELFRHLHLKDLAACSLVNRRWHSIYAAFKLDRLIVFERFQDFSKWSYPRRRVRSVERCQPELFSRLVDQPLLSNLKHLALSGKHPEFDVDKLNRFSQLVRLEIKEIRTSQKKVNLNLPKLLVLVVHSRNDRIFLSVDCPKLSLLVYEEKVNEVRTLLDVKHPETIKKLVTNISNLKLRQFRGAECLVTNDFKAISKATLLSLPKLKELHYNKEIPELFRAVEVGILDRVKRVLEEFLNDVRALRGPSFKFRFAGFRLTRTTLNEIDFGVKVVDGGVTVFNEYLYMKNYLLIDTDAKLDFINSIYYRKLMSNVPGELPGWFFEKFSGVQQVISVGAPDEKHLLWFLKSLSWLRKLYLYSLSQEFYNHLPASTNLLDFFVLGQEAETQLQLNFDFIARLPYLSYLYLNQPLSFESLSSLIRALGRFASGSFNFGFRRNRFRIVKTKDLKFLVIHFFDHDTNSSNGMRFEAENPEKVENFIEKFPSGTSKIG